MAAGPELPSLQYASRGVRLSSRRRDHRRGGPSCSLFIRSPCEAHSLKLETPCPEIVALRTLRSDPVSADPSAIAVGVYSQTRRRLLSRALACLTTPAFASLRRVYCECLSRRWAENVRLQQTGQGISIHDAWQPQHRIWRLAVSSYNSPVPSSITSLVAWLGIILPQQPMMEPCRTL